IDRRVIVEVSPRGLPRVADPVFDVALHAPDLGAAEIAHLLGYVRTDRPDGEIRDRILHAVHEPGRANGEVSRGLDVDAGFTADETFWSQVGIAQRLHRADAKLAIQLLERRCPETARDVPPYADAARYLIEGGHARTEHRVVTIGEGRGIARGWRTARD